MGKNNTTIVKMPYNYTKDSDENINLIRKMSTDISQIV